jgi:putative hydrolase of the HAD superfamily
MTNGRRIERTLLIDADDTLWENNIFYLHCTARFQDLMGSMECPRDVTQEVLDACERETVPVAGFGPRGYVMALGMACEQLLRRLGRVATPELVAQAHSLGEPVLAPPMILLPDVDTVLSALRPTSQLILVTKGSQEVQTEKIARSGLGPLFDAHYIVSEKDPATYRRIAGELRLNPRDTWMVGNSPRSDINPAVEAGLGAILIPHDHTWTAELQELTHPELVVALRRFADLLPFFGVEMSS